MFELKGTILVNRPFFVFLNFFKASLYSSLSW